jgi:GTPase
MGRSAALPVVVIIGRPNVGKSTLFNAICGTRRAIVGDEPGITRDRIHGTGHYLGRPFELIDTGGIIPNDAEMIPSQILKQARVALDEAAHIIYLIDGRTEITGADRDLARMLKKLGKPVSIAVNKIDSAKSESLAPEFYALGFPDLFPISSEHRIGLDELLEHVTEGFTTEEENKPPNREDRIRIAIIGRPNVGKSTLLNALVGKERSIVSPVAGTTRDAVDESVALNGMEYVFVDTAGIRRKGKTRLMAEKLSVVMARRHIRLADVVLLVIDAQEGVLNLDATIGGYAHEDGRAVVVCVNKWDPGIKKNQGEFSRDIRDELKFLDYAPVAFVSALKERGLDRLFDLVREAFHSASQRVSTGELNRFAQTLSLEPDVKVKYMTQAAVRPPTFVLFTDRPRPLHFSAERNVINRLRKQFGFRGTPIVVKTRVRQRST